LYSERNESGFALLVASNGAWKSHGVRPPRRELFKRADLEIAFAPQHGGGVLCSCSGLSRLSLEARSDWRTSCER
jgi:hypothetical protein